MQVAVEKLVEALEAVFESPLQPYGGVMCSTTGNYGSTFYDPFDRMGYVAFCICDECLDAAVRGHRLFYAQPPRPQLTEPTVTIWDGERGNA